MIRARVKNWPKFQHYRHRAPTWIKLHRALLDDFEFVRLPTVAKAVLPLVWLLAAEGEGEGEFDADPDYLAFRFRMPVHEVAAAMVPLVDQGFAELPPGRASELIARCASIIRNATSPALPSPSAPSMLPPPAFGEVQLDNQGLTRVAALDASDMIATGYQPARPEKSREEKEQEQISSVGNAVGAVPRDVGSAAAAKPEGPGSAVAITLPAKGGEAIELTRADVLELAELYPLVDVDEELRAIRGWLTANASRAKVGRKGTRRMVGTWLGKEQRRLADLKRNGKTPPAPSAVGRSFDNDEHRGQGAAYWLDPPPSTTED